MDMEKFAIETQIWLANQQLSQSYTIAENGMLFAGPGRRNRRDTAISMPISDAEAAQNLRNGKRG